MFKDFFVIIGVVLSIIFIVVKTFLWLSKRLIWFFFLVSANSKVTGVMYLMFFNKISAPCSIFLMRALSCFIFSDGWRFTKVSSFLPSFLFFSTVFGTGSLGVVVLDSGRVFASSKNKGCRQDCRCYFRCKYPWCQDRMATGSSLELIGTWDIYLLVS